MKTTSQKNKKPLQINDLQGFCALAERVGFEPTVMLPPRLISSQNTLSFAALDHPRYNLCKSMTYAENPPFFLD
ncbi:hypothetical protein [Diaphorobacter sp.]|uniref:hypothetical protein n=1 Tax=Diaphorobacter sp. TaxID=1934310 RepID=UPI0025887FE2|nr:hypothetical protein [Diaphorobacter sp.]